MGFKKYFIFSIILIVAVFGYVYSLELGDYNVSFFGYSLSLPVSAWVIAPISVLALATYLHILWYSMLNYFKKRAVKKDHESMLKMIKSSLLDKNEICKFRTQDFKNLFSILSQLKIDVQENRFSCFDDELNKIVANIQDVKNGKYVSDKLFKVNETTNLANLNMLNKVNEQIDFAVDVLKKPESFSSNIILKSFEKVLEEKSMTTMKKLYKNIKLDKKMNHLIMPKKNNTLTQIYPKIKLWHGFIINLKIRLYSRLIFKLILNQVSMETTISLDINMKIKRTERKIERV